MTSNVAYERSFAELSNGHGFSMVRVITLAKIIKTICSVFFLATVTRCPYVSVCGCEVVRGAAAPKRPMTYAVFI